MEKMKKEREKEKRETRERKTGKGKGKEEEKRRYVIYVMAVILRLALGWENYRIGIARGGPLIQNYYGVAERSVC